MRLEYKFLEDFQIKRFEEDIKKYNGVLTDNHTPLLDVWEYRDKIIKDYDLNDKQFSKSLDTYFRRIERDEK